jgi:hypothetical protein
MMEADADAKIWKALEERRERTKEDNLSEILWCCAVQHRVESECSRSTSVARVGRVEFCLSVTSFYPCRALKLSSTLTFMAPSCKARSVSMKDLQR